MGYKELLFRTYNNLLNIWARRRFAALTPNRNNEVFLEYHHETTQLGNSKKAIENTLKIAYNKLDENDKKIYDYAKLYVQNQFYGDGSVSSKQILENIDKLGVVRNAKLVEENEKDYDPELVKLEKLKAAVILQEEGAEEKLREFVKERPFMKKYLKWADLQEQTRYQYLG